MNSLKPIIILLCILAFIPSNAQVHIGQGVTSPNDWVDYTSLGIYVDVNTSACKFKTTPHYLVTIESITNSGYHWYTGGVPAIYNPTPTGFRVYLRWIDHPSDLPSIGGLGFPNPLRADAAKNRGWVIRWTGIEQRDCAPGSLPSRTIETSGNAFGKTTTKQLDQPEIKVSPNPSKNSIEIMVSDMTLEKIEIYNHNGLLLLTSSIKTIDISQLPEGNYIAKIYTETGSYSKQFIK
ncbi:T9SS type A sorting domain-containing protein [Aquimarina hainanensis]|uniref:T9SS type A sorting domain-containing protein n=1 Tax=Aquimarina hainanensis TaxID=1578017 RepID=A0ABW5NB69_9FLAO